ncbi:hypothetical protein ANN_03006 [Periplaneta americana]|uniref:Uncharacterized protein n=1 Tax=Periplaneta americana TaxID=6978 RepID=A0ABQ8TXU6_PERAM|nr:hypothetical protein ANN_03006 [Periplaneta americana]
MINNESRKTHNQYLRQGHDDQVYRTPVRDLADLQERIYAAVNNVTPQMLHNTWVEVEYRLDISRVTNGSHVEYAMDNIDDPSLEVFDRKPVSHIRTIKRQELLMETMVEKLREREFWYAVVYHSRAYVTSGKNRKILGRIIAVTSKFQTVLQDAKMEYNAVMFIQVTAVKFEFERKEVYQGLPVTLAPIIVQHSRDSCQNLLHVRSRRQSGFLF